MMPLDDVLRPDQVLPRIIPSTWHREPHPMGPGADREVAVFRHDSGMAVLISAARHQDGRRWLHVSVSRRNRLPSWEDLRQVKDVWIGQDRVAVQVLPRARDYVNIHPFCLHLWCCLDEDVVPDFTEGMGTI